MGLSVEVGDKTNVAHFLEGLAAVAASKGALVRAARLRPSDDGRAAHRVLGARAGGSIGTHGASPRCGAEA